MIVTEKFPYDTFPIRFEYKLDKTTHVCYFACVEHYERYFSRLKNVKTYTLEHRDDPSYPNNRRQNSKEKSKKSRKH